MQTSFFLVVTRKGATKTTQNPPRLGPGEVALHVKLELPNSLFETPVLQARISVPDSLAQPEPLTVEVKETVVEQIRHATGLTVELVVAPAPEPTDPPQ